MDYTEQQYLLHFADTRTTYVKIELLDFISEIIIDTIEGMTIDGSLTFNADSSIRRNGNLKISLIGNNSYLPSPNSYIWLKRKCRVWIGLWDFVNEKIVYFNKGCYVIDSPSVEISNNSNELSLSILDYMCLYDGTLNGSLMTQFIIDVGTPLSEAVKLLFKNKGGVTKFLIDVDEIVDDNKNPLLVPYKIEKSETDTIYATAKQLVDLYKGFQLYFDENGFLVYNKIKNKINNSVVFPFDATNEEGKNLVINVTNKYDFKNVKNYVQVFGKRINPLVATPSTDYTNENTINKLIVYYNLPLYDSNNQPLRNGTDVKSYFTYSGTASNFTSAIYNISTGYTITFIITGEQGKALTPIRGKIYNSCAIEYWNDKYEFCSTDQYKWSIPNYVTIDYTNNSIVKLVIKFNKPIYNSSGTKLITNTDVKSYFTYSGNSSNFASATYTSDNYDNAITMIFTTGINIGDTLNIVTNTIYDSAGFTIDVSKWTYIFDGTDWYLKTIEVTSDNQIQAISENNIAGHKFSIDAIGQRNLPIVNEKIYSLQQAESLSQYNLWCHSNMGEKVEISCVPIYMIDVNQLIYIKNNMLNIDGKYCITQISLPLKWNGIMNISCYLIYDENVI